MTSPKKTIKMYLNKGLIFIKKSKMTIETFKYIEKYTDWWNIENAFPKNLFPPTTEDSRKPPWFSSDKYGLKPKPLVIFKDSYIALI